MKYFEISANWPDSKSQILGLIEQFTNNTNFALLVNHDPHVHPVYIATSDTRMITALKSVYSITERESIDFTKDFLLRSNGQWESIGNRHLINF